MQICRALHAPTGRLSNQHLKQSSQVYSILPRPAASNRRLTFESPITFPHPPFQQSPESCLCHGAATASFIRITPWPIEANLLLLLPCPHSLALSSSIKIGSIFAPLPSLTPFQILAGRFIVVFVIVVVAVVVVIVILAHSVGCS